ncbi:MULTISPECIES: MAPEG family protein [unclassified Bradyrhizobium]|uniref:MAPEG family protein n=1 Tax=unclassified Bradyrhizobium TaxID=2631580 RepID=UPI0028E5D2EA|nr:MULTISPECIES: MAPEG family protein [unclassified Bradyrhizobium]
MAEDAAFHREQRQVATGMAAAALIAVAAIGIALWQGSGPAQPLAARLATALRLDLFVIVWLLAAIGNVARLRFFSVQDIAGSATTVASEAVRRGNAILQNTLEQAVLAVAVHLGLAATLPYPDLLLVALVILFGLGRLLFWLGYARGAAGRAFGFALTFYPTAFSLILGIVLVLTGRAA